MWQDIANKTQKHTSNNAKSVNHTYQPETPNKTTRKQQKKVQNGRTTTRKNNKTETGQKTDQQITKQTVKTTFNNTAKKRNIKFACIHNTNTTACKKTTPHAWKTSKKMNQTFARAHTPSVANKRENFPTARKRQPMKIQLANPGS